MTLTQAKKELSQKEWYEQGGASLQLYISYPWYVCSNLKIRGKTIPLKFTLCWFLKDSFMDIYILKESLQSVAEYYYAKQRRNPHFIQSLYGHWKKRYVMPYLRLKTVLFHDDFSHYSHTALLKLFTKFSACYRSVWHEAIFLDAFDYYGDTLLQKFISEEGREMPPEALQILLAPPFPSFLQNQQLTLLSIAEKIKQTGSKNLTTFKKLPWFAKALYRLEEVYHWLHNDYASIEYLNTAYFYKELKALLKNQKRYEKLNGIKRELRKMGAEKKGLYQKYGFSKKLRDAVEFLSFLPSFRDARKSCNQMAGNILRKFAEEFAKRSGLPCEDIELLMHWDIDTSLFNDPLRVIKKITGAKKGRFYIVRRETTFDALTGSDAQKLNTHMKSLIEKSDTLTGNTAYPGIATGIVKIIKDKRDFGKMKKGDILVAPNTRPEYLPLMKLASAVVSVEGGLTCHSAIVSRELKIPCIVGAQGATTLLKDGDTVKIDAHKGSIEKIANKK